MEVSKSSQQQPCLLITDWRGNCVIQTNMFNNKPQLLYDVGGEFPEFCGRRIGCSFGEWVLLTCSFGRKKIPEVLVNLLSKETIELPVLGMEYDFCALTSHPYDPNCHIVYFTRQENASMIFCQPGDKEFTIQKWDYQFFACAAVAGKLFLYMRETSFVFAIGVIEFKEATYRLEVVRMAREIRPIAMEIPLFFEYSGELFLVYKIRCGPFSTSTLGGIEIFKADFLNKKWVSVKSLGTNAIFIGNGPYDPAACASVESGGNSIYFFDHDSYYIYNLEDGTITMKPISCMETRGTQLVWVIMPPEASFPKLLKGDQESIFQDSVHENIASVEVEEAGEQNSWNMVPPELLNLIQLHLFGRDHAVFRVVCKPWQPVSSIQDHSIPALLSSTTLLELCQSSSPLLMFQEDLTISDDTVPVFRFFDPVHRKLYRTEIPELRGTDIHYSRDGWLLVSRRSDDSIFFFNPLTQEKIELPRMPLYSFYSAKEYTLSFSSPPTSSNCLVVGVSRFGFFSANAYTLKHGEETWREQVMVGKFKGHYARYPVVINGLHHFMSDRNRDMVVFNFKDGVEGQLPYCQTWSTKFDILRMEDFFLEIDGALAFVSVSFGGREMSIFKWNDLKKDWELMEGGGGVDFGGKEMFLSRRGSFMEKIDDGGGMGNTIFLPMIDGDAKEGVFYSLASRRYHTLYSGYSSQLPYNVDKFLNGIWVKPDRKIVGDSNLKWFM